METVTIRLPSDVKKRLQDLAQQSGDTLSGLLRHQAVELLRTRHSGSLHNKLKHLCGVIKGVDGMATGQDYLKQYK